MSKLSCLACLAMLAMMSVSGCDVASDPNNIKETKVEVSDVKLGSVLDYGNGVYYFPLTRASFANALSDFLKHHACKVEGMAGDPGGDSGNLGYFLICR